MLSKGVAKIFGIHLVIPQHCCAVCRVYARHEIFPLKHCFLTPEVHIRCMCNCVAVILQCSDSLEIDWTT